MGFPRQEYRSGLPFPSPGDLPNRGTETRSPPLQSESLSSELRRLRPVLELVLKNSSPNPAGLSETQSFERHKHAVFPSSPGKAIKLLFLLHSKPCLWYSIWHQCTEANFWTSAALSAAGTNNSLKENLRSYDYQFHLTVQGSGSQSADLEGATCEDGSTAFKEPGLQVT